MAFYAPYYAETTSDRTQSAPTGSSSSTTLTVTERAVLFPSSTHTLQASANATSTATWTLQRNSSTIGTIQISSGQSSGSTTLAAEQRLEPGDTLTIIAPSGTPFPGGTTLTMTWRFSLAAFRLIPQEPNRVWVNNGPWAFAKEIWVAEETTPGNYQWTRAWRIPNPPKGPKPDLEQWDSGVAVLNGGDIRASWTNTSSEFAMVVKFERFDGSDWVLVDSLTRSIGSIDAISDRSNYTNGDQIRAKVQYFEGSVTGDDSDPSDTLSYVDI
jgi:hypothetical protein